MRDVPESRVANLASLNPPRWQPHSLLAKFLLIVTPLFFILAVPGIGYLVHVGLRVEQEVLAARVGNQAARAAAALARHDTLRNPRLAQDLLAPLAADPAFVCAELRGGDRNLLLALPPAQGCLDQQDVMELVLAVREEEGSLLRVRFSDKELRAAERLQVSLAVSVVALAFVFAFLPAVIGFRLIVDRPLRLLLAAIRNYTETGERRPVQYHSGDELGTVIRAFDEMLRHESDREQALINVLSNAIKPRFPIWLSLHRVNFARITVGRQDPKSFDGLPDTKAILFSPTSPKSPMFA